MSVRESEPHACTPDYINHSVFVMGMKLSSKANLALLVFTLYQFTVYVNSIAHHT